MILITKFNDKEQYINPHLIESLESNPDTTIIFVNGKVLVIKEKISVIIDRIVQYRRSIGIEISEQESR